MFKDKHDPTGPTGDETIPARRAVTARKRPPTAHLGGTDVPGTRPPLLIQLFLDGEIDLDAELARRFPSPPLLSTTRFHAVTGQAGTALLSAQDGASALLVEADRTARTAALSFSFGSMLALRFAFDALGDMDRARWLDQMRREEGGVAFLWGQARWDSDYAIASVHRYFVTLYAFSPRGIEAAVRLTPDAVRQLVNWLASYWTAPVRAARPVDDLTTW
jgi:hypothetical protein